MSTLNRWFAVGLMATSAASHAAAQVEVVEFLARYSLNRPDPGVVEFGLNEPVTETFQNEAKRSEISVQTTFDGTSSFSLVLDASVGAGPEFCCGALEFDFQIRLRNATAAELPFGVTSLAELTGNASFKQAFVQVEPVGCTRLGTGGGGVPACDLGALPPDFAGTLAAGADTTLTVRALLGAPSSSGQGDGSARLLLNLGLTLGNSRTIRWDEPAGGAYTTAGNWNPEVVPVDDGVRIDRAIFGLPATPSPVQITASNASAGFWEVDGMNWDLLGSARVLGDSSKPDVPALVVQDGGKLGIVSSSTLETAATVVGLTAGAESQVFVEGVSPRWTDTEVLLIGAIGPGLVKVGQGGTLEVQGPIEMGNSPGISDGPGALKVESGGSVTATELTAGRAGDTIEVRGVGAQPSTLKLTSELRLVGDSAGTASLVIQDGGLVEAPEVSIDSGGDARVIVAGANANGRRSTLKVSGPGLLVIQGTPGPQIEVRDAASLLTKGARVGDSGGPAKVIVHNTDAELPRFDLATETGGAVWVADGDIQITNFATLSGSSDAAELVIESGGAVFAIGSMVVGNGVGGKGIVTLTDSGSALATGALVVGAGSSDGRLQIGEGAFVESTRATVGEGDGTVEEAVGSVTIGEGFFGGPAEWHVIGDLNVGPNGPPLPQLPSLAKPSGRIILISDFLPPGGLAKLRVGGTLTVGPRGAIEGSGTLECPKPNRVIMTGGRIRPGLSPGQITIEGDYEQREPAVLEIEVAGLEPGQFDVLHVTGDATLTGTVDLKFIDGFAPRPGDNINFVVVDGKITGKLTGGTLVDVPGDASAGDIVDGTANTIAVAEVVWEVTEEGTCRMTVTDVTPVDENGVPQMPDCGAGMCGAGAMPMLPLALISLATLKLSRGRCVRRIRVCRSRDAKGDGEENGAEANAV